MEDVLKYVLVLLLGALGPGVLVAYAVFVNQSAAEKWLSYFWRIAKNVVPAIGFVRRQYIKYDLQGRLNEFTHGIRKTAPFLATDAVSVQFVDGSTSRKSFLEDGKVVLRLRRDDGMESNFVHGAYLFVSSSLLPKVKHYIASTHREALDLYVTTKLLEKEKSRLVSIFLDEYLHPKTADADAKVVKHFDAFERIHQADLFFPVLLQELHFLGEKVFGKRRDSLIVTEVNDLLTFLETVAGRRIGQDIDLNFERTYCRFAVVIVGKSRNISVDGQVWVNFIRKDLHPKKIETIYLIGPADNEKVIRAVAAALGETYESHQMRSYRARSVDPDGEPFEAELFLLVMRLRGVTVFKPSQPE